MSPFEEANFITQARACPEDMAGDHLEGGQYIRLLAKGGDYRLYPAGIPALGSANKRWRKK